MNDVLFRRATIGDNGNVICRACRERHHDDCRGGSWCDCQHQRPQETLDEPPINWVRQG